jgi:hypothetical protein
MTRWLLALVLMAGAAGAQETAPEDGQSTLPEVTAPSESFQTSKGAQVRVLDKLTGTTSDLDLKVGAAQLVGRLGVILDDCRYPAASPASESYAHLTLSEAGTGADADKVVPLFSGWMVESSPALSALDHPRYDVWVLRCDLP